MGSCNKWGRRDNSPTRTNPVTFAQAMNIVAYGGFKPFNVSDGRWGAIVKFCQRELAED
jgi:hypothetical protein